MHGKIEIRGFFPAFDVITHDPELGPIASTVFGIVWRYCNNNGQCIASQGQLAKETGLSRATVNRWLKVLCEKGLLKDVTPVPGGVRAFEDTSGITVSPEQLIQYCGQKRKS